MPKHILFLHGAGEGAHKEDSAIVAGLRQKLGPDYAINYPKLPETDDSYEAWRSAIQKEIAALREPTIIVAHSVGGSTLLKYLSQNKPAHIAGSFLMAVPLWGGKGWHYDGYKELELPGNIATMLKDVPIYMYHCRDDMVVPFEHLMLFKNVLPGATQQAIDVGGHQFSNSLNAVTQDLKARAISD